MTVALATAKLPYTILVVDDEQLVRNVTAALLKRAGATLYLAEDAKTAIELYQAHSGEVDAALIDLTLVDLPGPDLADKLRAMNPNLLVAFMSGYSESRAADSDARTLFLAKPFRSEDLVKCMHELMAIDGK